MNHKEKETLDPGNQVTVHNNDVEVALRVFNKKVYDSGVLQDYENSRHYTKPSDKKRGK